jgi:hypothetical protein
VKSQADDRNFAATPSCREDELILIVRKVRCKAPVVIVRGRYRNALYSERTFGTMKLRRFTIIFAGLMIMALPAFAGRYYYTRIAPQMDDLASAESTLPGRCAALNRELHEALKHAQPRHSLEAVRAERESGVQLCAAGAEAEGTRNLENALNDLGLVPKS